MVWNSTILAYRAMILPTLLTEFQALDPSLTPSPGARRLMALRTKTACRIPSGERGIARMACSAQDWLAYYKPAHNNANQKAKKPYQKRKRKPRVVPSSFGWICRPTKRGLPTGPAHPRAGVLAEQERTITTDRSLKVLSELEGPYLLFWPGPYLGPFIQVIRRLTGTKHLTDWNERCV